MRRFNLFTLLYLATAAAFAVIAYAQFNNREAWLTAGLALLCAVLSLIPWWRNVIVSAGRRNSLIFDLVGIAIALAIQAYGLISDNFGLSYLVVGFVVLTLISTAEDAVVITEAERVGHHNGSP